MKIVCLIKFVPDVEEDSTNRILNPDDACALAYALMIKRRNPETIIEVVTMAPRTVMGHLEDLLRLNVDLATLISDKAFGGSDTWATTRILARYLQQTNYDVILTGTHSVDGDTAQVPSQLAEICDLPQMSNILAIEAGSFLAGKPEIEVDNDSSIQTFQVELPAILSVHKDSSYKLPYVAYQDLDRNVSSQVRVLTNLELGFLPEEVGLEGSKTQVNRTFVQKWSKEEKLIVQNDEDGIETVYGYLKKNGFLL